MPDVRRDRARTEGRAMKRAQIKQLVAEALHDVAAELDTSRPSAWPDSSDDYRTKADAINEALDTVQRALYATAENLTKKKPKQKGPKRS